MTIHVFKNADTYTVVKTGAGESGFAERTTCHGLNHLKDVLRRAGCTTKGVNDVFEQLKNSTEAQIDL